ncbi:MAG: peptidoglycan-binding protein LysM [Alphaproteobacteria bacterium]|nr:MAG: peptidoglycan-binding protein LysM [Alphaproteobacteria bacterium]
MQRDRKSAQSRFVQIATVLAVVAIAAGIWSVVAPPELPREWTEWFAPAEQPEATDPAVPGLELAEPAGVPADVTFPSFDVVRVTRGGTGVIAGRAAPYATVEILANGKILGRVEADNRGEWVLIFDDALPAGGSELSLTSRLPGKEAVQSPNIVVVVVPEHEEKGFVASSEEGVVAIRAPRDGKGRSTVLQKPPASPDFGGGLMVEAVDYDEHGQATFQGRAAARAEIRVYLDNELIGRTVASDQNRWVFTPEHPIAPGEHVLRLDQVIEEGKVELRIEVPFNRAEPLDVSRSEGSIVVRPGNNLWQISRKLYGTGFHYTLIFGANRDQIRDPDLIYPGQVFTLPKNAAGP